MQQPVPTTYVFKEVDGVPIHADVFLPTSTPGAAQSLPILLWFHGGGLLMSGRVGIGPHLRRAAEKYKIAVVSADYRLAPQVALPAIVEDVRDAAEWVRHGLPGILGDGVLDPSRLIVAGGSAGGYLALLAASPKFGVSPPPLAICAIYPITNPQGPFFTTPQRPVDGIIGNRVIKHEEMAAHLALDAPVLSGYGPVPYPPPAGDRGEVYLYMVQEAILEQLLFAKAPDANKDDFIPAKFWTKDMPPTYVFHGQVDNRVGIEQSHSFVTAMQAVGATYEFEEVPLPGAQHLFDQLDPTEEMAGMYDFLMRHF